MAYSVEICKIRSRIWNYYHCAVGEGMCFLMKLMGRSKLRDLAVSGTDSVSGAIAALCAELASATWNSPTDVRERYPAALVDSGLIRIPIGEGHCVDLIANYDTGMILVEFAGLVAKASKPHRLRGKAT